MWERGPTRAWCACECLGKAEGWMGLRSPERKWGQSWPAPVCPSPFLSGGPEMEHAHVLEAWGSGTRLVNFRGLPSAGDHQRQKLIQLCSLGRVKRSSSWVQNSGPRSPGVWAFQDLKLWLTPHFLGGHHNPAVVLKPGSRRPLSSAGLGRRGASLERVNSSGAPKAAYWRGLFLGFLLLKLKLCFNYIFLLAHGAFCILSKHPCQSFILVSLWVLLNPLHSQPYHLQWLGIILGIFSFLLDL